MRINGLLSFAEVTKLAKEVRSSLAGGLSRPIMRGAIIAVLAQVVFCGDGFILSPQSIPPKTREGWIERFTHRPAPPSGLMPGPWNARSQYSDLMAGNASAINDWSDIVGYYCEASPACEAAANATGPYLFSRGEYSSLALPSVVFEAFPSGINLVDQIVGPYFDANYGFHGFVLQGDHFTSIDAPEAGSGSFLGTVAAGINTQGDVVGQYFDANGIFHDFVWRAGKFFPFSVDIANSTEDVPTGINDRGDIVGYFSDNSGITHGYLLRSGVATEIDYPGATSTEALGINFEGDIVGFYTVPSTNPYASIYYYGFLLKNGRYTTINPPTGSSAFDGALTMASGINDFGVIVGSYQTPTGPGSAQILGFIRRW